MKEQSERDAIADRRITMSVEIPEKNNNFSTFLRWEVETNGFVCLKTYLESINNRNRKPRLEARTAIETPWIHIQNPSGAVQSARDVHDPRMCYKIMVPYRGRSRRYTLTNTLFQADDFFRIWNFTSQYFFEENWARSKGDPTVMNYTKMFRLDVTFALTDDVVADSR